MNQPKLTEFDSWRNTAIGIWFFEHYLQNYVDAAAMENGKAAGTYTSKDIDHMIFVRNAGLIHGIEYAINIDPFEEERQAKEEAKDET